MSCEHGKQGETIFIDTARWGLKCFGWTIQELDEGEVRRWAMVG